MFNKSGTIENCTNNSSSNASNASVSGVGGVCGYNDGGNITDCINSGKVNGEAATAGDICGQNNGNTTGCLNNGTVSGTGVLGGVCGNNADKVDNCYYDSDKYTGNAVGAGTAAANTEGKPSAAFTSGEVAWLLNTTDGSKTTNSGTWAQGTTMPQLAKPDKSDVIYRALFLPKTGATPVVAVFYLKSGATLTAPATMPEADATYRWIAPLKITTQPTASAAKTYGYTDKQSLTVAATTPLTGKPITYQWKKDGTAVSGATTATYAIPTGYAAGNHVYICDVTCDGNTLPTTAVAFTVNKATGTIINNKKYVTDYTSTGKVIANPAAGDFTTNAGTLNFAWYQGTKTLTSAPSAVGTYTLRVSAAASANVTAASLDVAVTINAPAATATPKPTTVPTATPKPTVAPSYDIAGFVSRLYTVCLGRERDSIGMADWVNNLTSYRVSGTRAVYGFVFSKECQSKNYTDADFVDMLYEVLMGRKADAAGKENWIKQLERGKSREEVFYGFANSTEFDEICSDYGIVAKDIETFVTRFYRVCLERKPDAVDLSDWSTNLRTKERTGRDVAFGFVFSPEFQSKKYSDEDYVEHLYAAFLYRKSDSVGKNNWVKQLQNGMSREQVFDGFVTCKEFGNVCAGYGITRG